MGIESGIAGALNLGLLVRETAWRDGAEYGLEYRDAYDNSVVSTKQMPDWVLYEEQQKLVSRLLESRHAQELGEFDASEPSRIFEGATRPFRSRSS